MAESRGVAILVGAGDAIGAAVARRFAKGGYTVCICRRDASKSQGLVGELRAGGHNIHAFSVDARQEAEVQGIFARIEKEFGPIEVCLFNAGSNVLGSYFEAEPPDETSYCAGPTRFKIALRVAPERAASHEAR